MYFLLPTLLLFAFSICANAQTEIENTGEAGSGPIHVPLPTAKIQSTHGLVIQPDVAKGEAIYRENCKSCHGDDGKSNTPVANALPTRPTEIGNPEVLKRLSPLKVYATISNGRPQTGMPSFTHLSEEQKWNVAAYIFLLDCNFQKPDPSYKPSIPWSEARDLTNSLLHDKLLKQGVPLPYIQQEIFAIRHQAP